MAGRFTKAGLEYEWEWVYFIDNQHGELRYQISPTYSTDTLDEVRKELARYMEPGDTVTRRKRITEVWTGELEDFDA
jgi:hypothetical protein